MREFVLKGGGAMAVQTAIEDLAGTAIQLLDANYSERVELLLFEWNSDQAALTATYTNHERSHHAHDVIKLEIAHWFAELREIEESLRPLWKRETANCVRDWLRGMFRETPYGGCREEMEADYGVRCAFTRMPTPDWMELL